MTVIFGYFVFVALREGRELRKEAKQLRKFSTERSTA